MGARTEEAVVDELEVTTTQLPATDQSYLLTQLVAVFGESLAHLLFALLGEGNVTNPLAVVMQTDTKDWAPALAAALGKLDKPAHDKMIVSILRGTEIIIDGRRTNLLTKEKIDKAFEGRFWTMYRVMWFALQVNYTSFSPADSVSAPPERTSAAKGAA